MNKITLEEYLHLSLRKPTVESYLYTLNHYLNIQLKAKHYTYQDIVNYLHELEKRGYPPNYRNKKLCIIKKYYDYLIYTEQREDHPCKRLTLNNASNRYIQTQTLFSGEELQQLLKRESRYGNLEIRNKVIIGLLIYQGITSNELIKLTTSDINLDEGTVTIKGSKNLLKRTLELHRTQITLLYKYIYQIREKLLKTSSSKLIINKRGLPITVDGIHAFIKPLKGLFGDRVLNPKTIRMSVIANWLNEHKISLEDVQLMAGHKYPSSTEKYQRKDYETQRELINQLHPLG